MNVSCHVVRELVAPLKALGMGSFAGFTGVFDVAALAPHRAPVLRVRAVPLPDAPSGSLILKIYELPGKGWRFLGRHSKARREFTNAGILARLGLPIARPIAWGEQRDRWGRLRQAFVVTGFLPDALTLEDFIQRHCPAAGRPESGRLRADLMRQVAGFVARMHAGGFCHRDLFVRNILVSWTAPDAPCLWFIDCPRGGRPALAGWRRQWRISDLASLDKGAAGLLRRSERVRFLLLYLGKTRLDAGARELIRAVQRYRRARWGA